MPSYPRLAELVSTAPPGSPHFETTVVTYLVDVWLSDYERSVRTSEIIETIANGFSYLFDIHHQRLIAAWGMSRGRHGAARDKARMAGHPLNAGPHYHRGHAVPHTLGGPTDINLVPQLGVVNIGPFRALEKRAVATPGSFYFTYWMYADQSQRPRAVEQGLLCPGQPPEIRRHAN